MHAKKKINTFFRNLFRYQQFQSMKAINFTACAQNSEQNDNAVTIKVTYLSLPQGPKTVLHNANNPNKTSN